MAGGEELAMEARPLAELGQGWHVAKDLIAYIHIYLLTIYLI